MALFIDKECINCGACEPECPNTAIYAGGAEFEYFGKKFEALSGDLYYIVPEKCTECIGFHEEPQCAAVCPVDVCIKDPDWVEDNSQLIAKKVDLHPA
ncbi:MAG: ferredoxin [Bacteroidetes bacterium RIFCSPLOWO2_02_FULL_36_8]|nr:MAG: ferredoxin [Bacteroidetes bacterium RIFCSPLOWO2_02_FULL_36_8]OFY69180.1 MAG: ferredoxin [Bacteroidetes bacterium RIFCSPLOWO2_12_FULL_37_12]